MKKLITLLTLAGTMAAAQQTAAPAVKVTLRLVGLATTTLLMATPAPALTTEDAEKEVFCPVITILTAWD